MASLYQKILFLLDKRAPRLTRSLVQFRAKFKVLDQIHASYAFLRLKWARHAHVKETILNLDQWERSFAAYLRQSPRNITMFQAFMKSGIETIRQNPIPEAADHLVLICVVKNDLDRLKMMIDHHRELGIQRFAILDNGSSDGTLEWLVQQNDIDVYQVKEKFQSLKKYGWINHLLARYGYDQWYLYVDSDELFVYPDCEQKALKDLIGELEQKGQDRMAAIMLDMYSEQEIYSPVDINLSIKESYPYFDSDSYQLDVSRRGPVIKGGPRKRLFAENQEDSPLLIKFPLFKLKPGMIFESAHYLFPYQLDHKIHSALLHYKFLASDLKRHETIAKDGNFQGGSREYKRYLNTFQENQHLTFMYSGSVKYENSASLGKIKLGDATTLGLT